MRLITPLALSTLLLSFNVVNVPVIAANEYQVCAKELKESGITDEQTAIACGKALRPMDLSLCVTSLNQKASIPGGQALDSCFRVRRPLDLASCVVNINAYVLEPDINLALDNCSRSLFPKQFASCVIGLNRATPTVSFVEAADKCIAAN